MKGFVRQSSPPRVLKQKAGTPRMHRVSLPERVSKEIPRSQPFFFLLIFSQKKKNSNEKKQTHTIKHPFPYPVAVCSCWSNVANYEGKREGGIRGKDLFHIHSFLTKRRYRGGAKNVPPCLGEREKQPHNGVCAPIVGSADSRSLRRSTNTVTGAMH